MKCLRSWEEVCAVERTSLEATVGEDEKDTAVGGWWDWITNYFQSDESEESDFVGGTDANGCHVSAGYTWCEEKMRCLRSWEEVCAVERTSLEATVGEDEKDTAVGGWWDWITNYFQSDESE